MTALAIVLTVVALSWAAVYVLGRAAAAGDQQLTHLDNACPDHVPAWVEDEVQL